MRIITEDYLRKLAWKGLLTITKRVENDTRATVRWIYGEDEDLLITQNQ